MRPFSAFCGATAAANFVTEIQDGADGGAVAGNKIKAFYELGINDAPSIKQGTHKIDNSTYVIKN